MSEKDENLVNEEMMEEVSGEEIKSSDKKTKRDGTLFIHIQDTKTR